MREKPKPPDIQMLRENRDPDDPEGHVWWFLFWVFSLTGLTFAFLRYLTWACKG